MKRKLGSSELMLSPIGLGCWQFSKGKGMVGRFWPDLDAKEIESIVKASVDGGNNWFDTAEAYGNGASEQQLSSALNNLGMKEEQVHIATKWFPFLRVAENIPITIEKRKAALQGWRIDLYQIHQPYSLSSIDAEMKQMANLVEKDHIRYIGVSNYSATQMRKADQILRSRGLRLVSNQVRFNLLDRSIEQNGILETAKELDIAIIAYSPLEQGLLTGKFHQDSARMKQLTGFRKWLPSFNRRNVQQTKPLINRLKELADQYKVSSTQIALNWTIHVHGDTIFAIPGATKVQQAEENSNAMKFRLTEDEIHELSQLSIDIKKK
ncbi:Predicted oxidoreductase [Seinonella peptonophila]|uniref:Predicted oxidoreductase n=1 Tax=Seinonella peptonophila TaxID=112248 RepID=A0A1M4SRN9_9BACL|nr:aldo/keto reductase [Seinonella peptonophila]SHE34869.1 Predicted oxidoreductase [Seinonella peptonophila]